jgi:predicted SnoaL-like aldol condensation-catalyzing enzyme
MVVAGGDYVMLHGRFSGRGEPANLVAVDIVRVENGVLAEHWDVLQDEATRQASKSGEPMFGDAFPDGGGPQHVHRDGYVPVKPR